MNDPNSGSRGEAIRERPLATTLDRTFAFLGILISIFIIVYMLLIKGSPLYMLIGALTIVACSLWLINRKEASESSLMTFGLGTRTTNLLLASAFFILFIISIILVYTRSAPYERPLSYFIVTSIMIGIVGVECLYAKGRWVGLVLAQVVILGLSLAWTQALISPGLLESDPWFHKVITEQIVSTGSVPTDPIYSLYSQIPLFHILVGSGMVLTGLDYKTSALLLASSAQILCNSLFAFLLARFVTKNLAVGLFASLFVAISDYSILMSAISIPSSLAAIFIPIVLFLLIAMIGRAPTFAVLAAATSMIALVLTHAVASMWLAATLVIGLVTAYWFLHIHGRRDLAVSPSMSSFFIIIMLAWWTYISTRVADSLIQLVRGDLFREFQTQIRPYVQVPVAESIASNLGMYLLFGIALVGVFYMMRRGKVSFTVALMGLTPLMIALVSMVAQMFVNQQRWFYFAEIALAIPAAVAIILLSQIPKGRRRKAVFVALVMIPLAFMMILSTNASTDNTYLFPTAGEIRGMTASELQGIGAMEHIWGKGFTVDGRTEAVMMWPPEYHLIEMDTYLETKNFNPVAGSCVLVRDSVVYHVLVTNNGLYKLDYDPRDLLISEGFSRVYAAGTMQAFIATR